MAVAAGSGSCCGCAPAEAAPALPGSAYPSAVSIAEQQRLFSGKLEAVSAAGGPARRLCAAFAAGPHCQGHSGTLHGVRDRYHHPPHGLTFMLVSLQR